MTTPLTGCSRCDFIGPLLRGNEYHRAFHDMARTTGTTVEHVSEALNKLRDATSVSATALQALHRPSNTPRNPTTTIIPRSPR